MLRYCSAARVAALIVTGCNPAHPTPNSSPAQPSNPAPQANPNPGPPPPPMNPTPLPPPPTPPAPPPNPQPPGPSPDEKAKQRRSLLEAKFVRLSETMIDKKPFYTIEVDMKNVSGKDMKLFQGGVWFYDEAGKDIYLIGDTYGPVKAGETVKRGYSPPNLDDAAVAYMKAHPDKVKVEFEANRIENTDGSKVQY